jgi:hypothetical protein
MQYRIKIAGGVASIETRDARGFWRFAGESPCRIVIEPEWIAPEDQSTIEICLSTRVDGVAILDADYKRGGLV